LILAQVGGEWSASLPGHCVPGTSFGTQSLEGCVGPRDNWTF